MKAIYKKRVIKAGRTLDVECTYPTRFGEGLTRVNHVESTPEAMQLYNEELAIRKLARILNENFSPDDWFITFHYEEHNRPSNYDEAYNQLKGFMRQVRKLYKEWGIELKYVKRTAYGERGGVHHHVVMPQGKKMRELSALWKEYVKATMKARAPDCRPLYELGEYSSLAAYIVRQSAPKDLTYVKKWVGSRNLKKSHVMSEEKIHSIKWKEPPVAPPGYYIDKDSIRAGVNPITNKPYLFYRAIKPPSDFHCYDDNGKRIYGSEAIKYFRRHNRNWIKENWKEIAPEGEIVFLKGENGIEQKKIE